MSPSPVGGGGLSTAGWKTAYKDYFAPDFKIKIDGNQLDVSKYAVHDLEVECTCNADADTCTFSLSEVSLPADGSLVSEWPGTTFMPGASLSVSMGYADTFHDVFSGLITHASISVQSDSNPRIQVRGMDYSVQLMAGRVSEISWANRTYSDVVTDICSTHSLTPDVDATTASIPFILRFDPTETDHQYLQRLAALTGYDFFVTGKKLCFKKPGWNSSKDTLTLFGGVDVMELDATADLASQITAAKVYGWDLKQKLQVTGESSSLTNDQGTGKLGKNLLASSGFKGAVYASENVASQGDANARAEIIFRTSAREFLRGRVKTVGIPEIKPADHVRIKHAGTSLDQKMDIVRTVHSMDDSGYTTQLFFRGTKV